jgi:hypothetical protein
MVLLAKQFERLRCECDELANKRINVELRLAILRPIIGNVSSAHGKLLGEIFIQLKYFTSSMSTNFIIS